jgi:two-component system response regulator YesN
MFRIVIADDEPFIVKLIRQLIDCEGLGVEIVGEASDGAAALKLVREKKPDILITDIRMPLMDGIELIEEIHQDALPVRIIAISGHRRFDYAYNALKYGVEDFIVKPISKKELNDSIDKLLRRLKGEEAIPRELKSLERQVQRGAARLREKLIDDCLAGRVEARSLEALNEAYLCRFEPGHFTGVSVRLDFPQELGEDSPVASKSRDAIAECMRDFASEYVFALSARDSGFYGVVNTRPEQTGQLVRRIKRLFEKLTMALDFYANIPITIGIGTIVSDPAEIADSVRAAAVSVRIKCILGAHRIYYSEDYDRENLGVRLSGAQIEALRSLLDENRPERVAEWLESVYRKPESYYQDHPIEALALTDSTLSSLAVLCRMQSISVAGEELEFGRIGIERCASLPEIVERVGALIRRIMERDRNQRIQRGSFAVERAKAFIAEHLVESFRLEDVAESVTLSPAYLSSLFKKETGENLSDYVQRLRLERAKALLKSTNLTIQEIAAGVGYADAKHFSKLFSRMTGARPQDYRKMYAW